MAEKEYIEREAFFRFIEERLKNYPHIISWLFPRIADAPTADVVEVRYAEKANSAISETGLMCRACYSDVDRDAVWCKYCGAKMKEKE